MLAIALSVVAIFVAAVAAWIGLVAYSDVHNETAKIKESLEYIYRDIDKVEEIAFRIDATLHQVYPSKVVDAVAYDLGISEREARRDGQYEPNPQVVAEMERTGELVRARSGLLEKMRYANAVVAAGRMSATDAKTKVVQYLLSSPLELDEATGRTYYRRA